MEKRCVNVKVCDSPGSSCLKSCAFFTSPSAVSDTPFGVTASVPALTTVTWRFTSRSVPTRSLDGRTAPTARFLMEVGSGSVRHVTIGWVLSDENTRPIVFQRSLSSSCQPTVWPSPTMTICLTALWPAARVTAAAVRLPAICMVPFAG